jgi:hypothetical protein
MIGNLTLCAVGYIRVCGIIELRNLSYNMTCLVYFVQKNISIECVIMSQIRGISPILQQ